MHLNGETVKNRFAEVLDIFCKEVTPHHGQLLAHILFQKFECDSRSYLDPAILDKVCDYLKRVVIPHKTEVYKAGMTQILPWIERNLAEDAVMEFEYNLFIHDLSKFSDNEVFGYMNYNFKTNEGKEGFERAWHHHKMNNPHHPEYWLNPNRGGQLEPLPMPAIFVAEMIADWIGAGKTYGTSLKDWLPDNLFKFKFHSYGSVDLVRDVLSSIEIKTRVIKGLDNQFVITVT